MADKTGATQAQGPQPGDKAPAFNLHADGGGAVSLAALKGKRAVLYFYPKDDTSGCTLEAHEFSALAPKFAAAGVEVFGVSPDAVASHDRFVKKHGLRVRLLADPDKAALEAYGVWVEKSLYGRKYMGVERATFLIGADGRIERVWRKVKAAGHAAAVLEAATGGATSGPKATKTPGSTAKDTAKKAIADKKPPARTSTKDAAKAAMAGKAPSSLKDRAKAAAGKGAARDASSPRSGTARKTRP